MCGESRRRTYVRSFWEQFQIVLNAGCSNATSVTLNENIVLFGHDIHCKSDNTFELIILQAKFFIYKCKINKIIPQLHLFKRYLKLTLRCTNDDDEVMLNVLRCQLTY